MQRQETNKTWTGNSEERDGKTTEAAASYRLKDKKINIPGQHSEA